MSNVPPLLAAALGDRYRLERELGSGGMATVYHAHDLRHGRQVAIKVLKPELAAALGSERFLREIEICARLHHPHILPLFDSGDASGLLYYVMPRVEGESLRERLARGAVRGCRSSGHRQRSGARAGFFALASSFSSGVTVLPSRCVALLSHFAGASKYMSASANDLPG